MSCLWAVFPVSKLLQSDHHLVCQPEQHAEEASQVSLSGWQLTSAGVVCSVQSCGAVHDQQSVPDTQPERGSVCVWVSVCCMETWFHTTASQAHAKIDWPGFSHHGRGLVQQLCLMVCVEGSSVGHVVQNITSYQSVPDSGERSHDIQTPTRTLKSPVQVPHFNSLSHSQTVFLWWVLSDWGGNVLIHLSATASSLSGLKVPSVSMYMALPSPPPWSIGSCKTECRVTLSILN